MVSESPELLSQEASSSLESEYPAAVAMSKAADPSSMLSWDRISTSRDPKRELEAAVVYDVLSTYGPDVSYTRVKKLLRSVSAAVRSFSDCADILDCYESGELENVLDEMGMFGTDSDQLRDDGNKFY